ncbi:hypothetical protein JCM10213_004521 [Rhodosporidiobolus nylandii]
MPAHPQPVLPPELLLQILGTSSRATLLRASLVSRSWRGPARHLLESRLSLPTSKVARSWLSVPGRKTRTRRLSLGAGLGREECERVFETVEGVEELALMADPATPKGKFDVRALQSKELAGLRQLHIHAPLLDIPSSEAIDLPFSLEALSCKGMYRSFPRSALCALVASSSGTLAVLDLDAYGSNPSAEAFIACLAPLSSTVTSLELHGSDRQTAALLSFLSTCTALSHFTCWEATLPVLSALSPSTKHVAIGKNFLFHGDPACEELLVRSGLLRQLNSLTFSGISSATLRAQVGGVELMQECEERGIVVEFGVEVSGRYGTFGFPTMSAWKLSA